MSPGERFVQDLLDAMPSPASRLRLLARIARYAGQTIYLPAPSKADRRIQAAANMLQNGMAAGDIAAAIHDRFGVCLRSAQRDVKSARKMSTEFVALEKSNTISSTDHERI